MTFHDRTPLPRLIAPGGPVSKALRLMREHDPEMARIVELRRAIAARIEADIELLDALAGDPDFEDGGDDEPSLGAQEVSASGHYIISHYAVNPTTSQLNWGASGTDDREEENENGGDVQDEPHDEETDKEPSLCGITVDPRFANGTDEGEASLGSLGGTAAGCEQSQKGWDKGDRKDREIDGGSPVHRQDWDWRNSSSALAAVKDRLRNLRRPRATASMQIAGPNSNVYVVQAWGRR